MLASMAKIERDPTRAAVERAFRDAGRTSAAPTLVEELELSMRAYNVLTKAKIITVAQLLQCSMFDLFKMPRMGGRTLRDIVETLRDAGMALRSDQYDRVMRETLRQDVLFARRQALKRQKKGA